MVPPSSRGLEVRFSALIPGTSFLLARTFPDPAGPIGHLVIKTQ